MKRPFPILFSVLAVALFFTAPLAAQQEPTPADPATKPPEAAPADVDIGPPGDIVVPKPEEVQPKAVDEDGVKLGDGVGDLRIRAPYADVEVGDGDGNPRVRVRAPYTDVRINERDGIHVDTPIGPIRIGGGGGLNLRDLGDRLGVRVEADGVAVDPADALPRRDRTGRAVLGVQLHDDEGIRIESVRDGGPADKANLTPGDRVVSMNGYVFDSADALTAEIARLRPGDRVQLTIERDGRLYRANARLESRQ